MTPLLSSFARDDRGSAGAEMALSVPMLIALMLGAFELGYYFLCEHVVTNSVRDAARYAARLSYAEYPGCSPSATAVTSTRNVARTGQPSVGGTPRLSFWTNPATITVTASCTSTVTSDGGTTYNLSGIYYQMTGGAPVVRVTAVVPYTMLIGRLGIFPATLNLRASSESPVNGV